jgi:16S rRNA processing protein RimM
MFVSMGELVRAVGLLGELKFLPDGDYLASVMQSPYLRRRRGEAPSHTIAVERSRVQGESLVLKFRGVDDREGAEAMVGESIGFLAEDYDRPDFPRPAQPHPFVYHGLRVETVGGEVIGEVEAVMVLPANLVLEVRAEGGREHLIPVIPPVVRTLDREGGRLVIEAMPGLLSEEDE